jgi:hypothetical protein
MDTYPMIRTTVEAEGENSVTCTNRRWDAPNTTAAVETQVFKKSLTEALEESLEYAHSLSLPTSIRMYRESKLVEYTLEFYLNNHELGVEFTLSGDL